MRGTDVLASIDGGNGRKNLRKTRTISRALDLRLSIEFGCRKRIDASKFLRLTRDIAHFSSYIQNLDKDNSSMSEYHSSEIFLTIPVYPGLASAFCNISHSFNEYKKQFKKNII